MAREWEENSPDLWVKAVEALPQEPIKSAECFSRYPSYQCQLAHFGNEDEQRLSPLSRLQTITSSCIKVAMECRKHSRRHDEVLKVIGDFIKAGLPSHFSFTINHSSGTYSFPHYITPTGLLLDIVWWSDQQKELWLLELTISY